MLNVNKYSIIGVFVRTIRLGGRVFDCWQPIATYAALLVLLNYVFSAGARFYGFTETMSQNLGMFIAGAVYTILYIHLFLSFMVDFYSQAFNGEVFALKNLWQRSKRKWYAELFLLSYAAAYVIPFGIAAKLLTQQANPDWRIEFIYFCIIFAVFVLILLLVRLLAAVSRGLSAECRPDFMSVFKQTSGRAYVGIVLFLVLLMLILLSSMRLNIWLGWLPLISPWLDLPAVWLSFMINLAFLALMLVFSRAQDELLALKQDNQN